jgi:hypothetical protein
MAFFMPLTYPVNLSENTFGLILANPTEILPDGKYRKHPKYS